MGSSIIIPKGYPYEGKSLKEIIPPDLVQKREIRSPYFGAHNPSKQQWLSKELQLGKQATEMAGGDKNKIAPNKRIFHTQNKSRGSQDLSDQWYNLGRKTPGREK